MDTPIRRLRMEDVLWHKAEKAAEDLDRTASWVIRQALEEFLERHRAGKQAERGKADRSAGVYVVQFEKQAANMLEAVSKSTEKEPSELIRIAVDRFLDRSKSTGKS
jgi:predicted transcriptional regulator